MCLYNAKRKKASTQQERNIHKTPYSEHFTLQIPITNAQEIANKKPRKSEAQQPPRRIEWQQEFEYNYS